MPLPQEWPFAYTLIVAILLIVISTIGLLSAYDYLQAEERMTSDLNTLQSVTEKSIRESIVDVDTGLKPLTIPSTCGSREGFRSFLRSMNGQAGIRARWILLRSKQNSAGIWIFTSSTRPV